MKSGPGTGNPRAGPALSVSVRRPEYAAGGNAERVGEGGSIFGAVVGEAGDIEVWGPAATDGMISAMSQNIAVVGAYGSGKTLLSRALSHATGLPYTQGTAMREPIGGEGKHIWKWTPGELLQLTVKRYAERVVNEGRQTGGFISDGSILHEYIFAKLRLVVGPVPESDAPLDTRFRDEVTAALEEVADNIGRLAQQHAATAYDVFFHLPIEFGLAEDNRPINEHFRSLSDQVMLPVLDQLGVPVHSVTGSPEERLEKVLAVTGLPTVMDVGKAVALGRRQ
ncbi:AAA family ATPase [Streptomyces sp. NPDC088760]|uniref:AAA family ATPase n=1 Tax=Streptomyces sp. NPDC088760 TaxID=3365890 RepID=UPI003826A19E